MTSGRVGRKGLASPADLLQAALEAGGKYLAHCPVCEQLTLLITCTCEGSGGARCEAGCPGEQVRSGLKLPADTSLITQNDEVELDLVVPQMASLVGKKKQGKRRSEETDAKKKEKTDWDLLLEAVKEVDFFHTPDREPYCTFPVGEHKETHSVRSKDFRLYLRRGFYELSGKCADSELLSGGINHLHPDRTAR